MAPFVKDAALFARATRAVAALIAHMMNPARSFLPAERGDQVEFRVPRPSAPGADEPVGVRRGSVERRASRARPASEQLTTPNDNHNSGKNRVLEGRRRSVALPPPAPLGPDLVFDVDAAGVGGLVATSTPRAPV